MLAFTLAALIVMGQKGVHRDTGDSTLMGTSLFAAFMLWLILTIYLYGAAKVRSSTMEKEAAPLPPHRSSRWLPYYLASFGSRAPSAPARRRTSVAARSSSVVTHLGRRCKRPRERCSSAAPLATRVRAARRGAAAGPMPGCGRGSP